MSAEKSNDAIKALARAMAEDILSKNPPKPMTLDDMSDTQKAIFFFLIGIPGTLWSGLAISIIWGWFIVPLGVMSITAAHGAGLHVLYSAVKAAISSPDLSKLVPSKVASHMLMSPILLVAIAWPFSWFI